MKTFRKFVITTAAILILLSAFYIFWLSPRYTVPILMYHRFGYQHYGQSTLWVSPENFQKQMAYLRKNGYNVIALDELVEGIKAKRKFEHNIVVITIDDGYMDNYKYAYPILKKYGFPVIIFLAANLIGNNKEFLSWDETRTMSKDNITFGAHTKNHAYLPSISDKETLWDEIAGAKKIIEANTGAPIDYFCYPTGGFSDEIRDLVKRAGYKAACTTNRGLVDFNKDIYELKRIKVTNSDTNKPFGFWAKLSGYYNLFRKRKRGL